MPRDIKPECLHYYHLGRAGLDSREIQALLSASKAMHRLAIAMSERDHTDRDKARNRHLGQTITSIIGPRGWEWEIEDERGCPRLIMTDLTPQDCRLPGTSLASSRGRDAYALGY